MAGFHLPGDPYFPNQGNADGVDDDSDDDHQIALDDHQAEGFSDGSDSDPEVNNLPQAGQVQVPNHPPEYQGPTPLWATTLNHWADEQGQPPIYHGDRRFYNVSQGGSADRVLPVMVRRIARNTEQGRSAIDRVMEVDAYSGVNTTRIGHLETAVVRHERTHGDLQQQLTASRAEVFELRARQRTQERHLQDIARQLANMRIPPRNAPRRQ